MTHVHLAADTACEELRQEFLRACCADTDIHEHLTVLRDTASGQKHITELGVGTGQSTLAWLLVQPDKLVLVDAGIQLCLPKLHRLRGRTEIVFIHADTRRCDLEPTDILFIDTAHHRAQLMAELDKHAHLCRGYILLHDTTTFARHGEAGDHNEPGQGLCDALDEWLPRHPEWQYSSVFHNNNGLTILKRVAQ